jgi:hypothetical protein
MILFFMIRLPMTFSISAGPDPAYQIPLYLRNPAGSAEGEEKRPGMFYATLGRHTMQSILVANLDEDFFKR